MVSLSCFSCNFEQCSISSLLSSVRHIWCGDGWGGGPENTETIKDFNWLHMESIYGSWIHIASESIQSLCHILLCSGLMTEELALAAAWVRLICFMRCASLAVCKSHSLMLAGLIKPPACSSCLTIFKKQIDDFPATMTSESRYAQESIKKTSISL